MLVLSHDDVVAALGSEDCATAMREILVAHARGETHMPLRSLMRPPAASGMMGLMPAWRSGGEEVFSLKAICLMPANPSRGLDAHQGVVTLFDGETGVPLAVLDASAVTKVRTAAVSAVATDLLARPEARVLAVIGAGVQARAHVEALLKVREFAEARVYAPTTAHSEALAAEVGAPATPSATAEEAVRGADVVVTATNSRKPVLELEWLGPGAHINCVGASTPSALELTPETVASCALFPDSRESIRSEAGEYQEAVKRGLIGEEHIRGELGEVLAGLAPGRQDEQEITLFRSLGLAVEDLAAAQYAVRNAARLGLGTEVHM